MRIALTCYLFGTFLAISNGFHIRSGPFYKPVYVHKPRKTGKRPNQKRTEVSFLPQCHTHLAMIDDSKVEKRHSKQKIKTTLWPDMPYC